MNGESEVPITNVEGEMRNKHSISSNVKMNENKKKQSEK